MICLSQIKKQKITAMSKTVPKFNRKSETVPKSNRKSETVPKPNRNRKQFQNLIESRRNRWKVDTPNILYYTKYI